MRARRATLGGSARQRVHESERTRECVECTNGGERDDDERVCATVCCVVPLPASGGDPARWRLASGVSLLSVVGNGDTSGDGVSENGVRRVGTSHHSAQRRERRADRDVQFLFYHFCRIFHLPLLVYYGLALRDGLRPWFRGVRLEDEVFTLTTINGKKYR